MRDRPSTLTSRPLLSCKAKVISSALTAMPSPEPIFSVAALPRDIEPPSMRPAPAVTVRLLLASLRLVREPSAIRSTLRVPLAMLVAFRLVRLRPSPLNALAMAVPLIFRCPV